MANKSPQLSISAQPDKAPPSAGQKKFNSLLKKIETQRQLLEAWQTALPAYQQLWSTDFKPLLDEHRQHDMDLLHFLDDASDRIKFSEKDRQTLQEIICELVTSLMGGEQDAALKLIYAKQSGSDFDTVQLQEKELFRMSLEKTYGVDIGDDVDLDSTEDVTQRIREKLKDAAEKLKQSRKPQKKSAQEIRQEEEHAKGSQSVRDIYRKLASALHPDRETDITERDRKTALMQRANQAYADSDLLGLLQLQLEVEQIDQHHINSMSEERLKHYNRVLANQLQGLQHEIQDLKISFNTQFLLEPFEDVKPANMARKCKQKLRGIRDELLDLKEQLMSLSDTKTLKRWLKEQRDTADFSDWLDMEMPESFMR